MKLKIEKVGNGFVIEGKNQERTIAENLEGVFAKIQEQINKGFRYKAPIVHLEISVINERDIPTNDNDRKL